MAVSKNMQEAVEKGDVDDIRICLHSQIFMDITFASGSFDGNMDYLKKKLGNKFEEIYQPHDERNGMVLEGLEPTEASLKKLMADLAINFSQERLEKMRELADEWRKTEPKTSPDPSSPSTGAQDHSGQNERSWKPIVIGGAVGAAAGGGMAIVAETMVLPWLLGGAVAGGIVGYLIRKGQS